MDTTTGHVGSARVADVMTTEPVTLDEDDSVHVGGAVLLREGISGAPVIDRDGGLAGVFSHSDVLARFAAPRQRRGALARLDDRHARAKTVGEACSRPAITIGPDATVDTAARELLDRDIGRLVVVAHGTVVGVLSRSDVLKLLLPEWRGDTPDEVRRRRRRGVTDSSHLSQIEPD
jgi:CBS domain-containing protein